MAPAAYQIIVIMPTSESLRIGYHLDQNFFVGNKQEVIILPLLPFHMFMFLGSINYVFEYIVLRILDKDSNIASELSITGYLFISGLNKKNSCGSVTILQERVEMWVTPNVSGCKAVTRDANFPSFAQRNQILKTFF